MNKQTANAKGDSAKYHLSLPELFDMFMEWIRVAGRPQVSQVRLQVHLRLQAPEHAVLLRCDKRFSVKIGTVMAHSKISYRNWAIATYLLATRPKGISSVSWARILE